MRYLDYFMRLKCAGDVLNSVHPILNPTKEVTESMSIIKRIKPILVSKPDKYYIFDLCAGNCLTSSLTAHLFKVKKVFAIDKAERYRKGFSNIRGFEYVKMNIYDEELLNMIKSHQPSIIISVHPCSHLAERSIELFKESLADLLLLMPCCSGGSCVKNFNFLKDKLTKYELWSLYLSQLADGKIYKDIHCLSPKNIVIVASRENI